MVYGDPSHGYHGISQSNLGIHHGFVGHQTWGSDGFRLGKMSRVMKARNQKGMHLVYLVYVYSFFFWIPDDLVDATEKRVGMIEMMEKN